ncbi:MAG: ComEC/Rec2 family competence protein [Pseudomonadota bacterium]
MAANQTRARQMSDASSDASVRPPSSERPVADLVFDEDYASPWPRQTFAQKCFEGVLAAVDASLSRGNGIGWLAVALGTGISVYYALAYEPKLWATIGVALALAVAAWRLRNGAAFTAALAAAMVVAGVALAGLHTWLADAPQILEEDVMRVEGRVESVEQRQPNRARLVLRDLTLEDRTPEQTPRRIRITALAEPGDIQAGQTISALVQLGPPPEPVMPGARNLRRELFLRGIGATGFTYGRPEVLEAASGSDPRLTLRAQVQRLRSGLAERYTQQVSGDAGILVATLLVGKREGLPEDTYEALRRAGLAHLLAISGMHMALMTFSAIMLVQIVLAFSPNLSTSQNAVRLSAIAALALAAGYLVLSGAGTATQRAFVMIALALTALMLGRRALTIRAVALAAICVMVIKPHSILGPSFQMSFAATTALVAGYAGLSRSPFVWRMRSASNSLAPAARWTMTPFRALLGIALTSLIAGLATAPFAAFHFSAAAPHSLVGNLLAMPIVSLIVMPAGLLTLLATPFALEAVPLWLMANGINGILAIAHEIAQWPSARLAVPALHSGAVIALAVSGLCAALLAGSHRWVAVVPLAVTLPLTGIFLPTPDVLIDRTGSMVALVRHLDQGTVIDRTPGRGQRFAFERWQERLAAPPAGVGAGGSLWSCDDLGCVADLPSGGLIGYAKTAAALQEDCRVVDVMITTLRDTGGCVAPLVVSAATLEQHGAVALVRQADPDALWRVWQSFQQRHRPWQEIASSPQRD